MYKDMFNPKAMDILVKYVEDFNSFSKLIEMNYHDLENVPVDDEEQRQRIEGNLKWNKACRYCVKEFLENLSNLIGIKLNFDYGPHHMKYGFWEGDMFFQTVDIEYEE